jgi:hypothetical protein
MTDGRDVTGCKVLSKIIYNRELGTHYKKEVGSQKKTNIEA